MLRTIILTLFLTSVISFSEVLDTNSGAGGNPIRGANGHLTYIKYVPTNAIGSQEVNVSAHASDVRTMAVHPVCDSHSQVVGIVRHC